MTLSVKLQFGDNITKHYNKEYLVVNYHNGIGRMYNAFNPLSTASDRDIQVTIVSPAKEDLSVHDWFATNSVMSGRLVFDIMDVNSPGGSILRHFYFYDAQCVSLKDSYDTQSSVRRQLTLVFTPAKVKIEDISFTRDGSHTTEEAPTNDDDEIDMKKYNLKFDF